MIKFRAFFSRYFNEIQSVHGRRPAASWSQSALQLPGSPSAAQTMRGRWDINDASTQWPLQLLPVFKLIKMNSLQKWAGLSLKCIMYKMMCSYFVCLPLQVMEFYCESCETAMCLDCTEGEHREHVTVPLRDVVEQHKAVLKTQLDAIRSRWGFDCLIFGVLKLKHLAQIWHLPSNISYIMLCFLAV